MRLGALGLAAALLLIPAAAPVAGAAPSPTPAILIASDSTAADAAETRYPQMGWGTMLRCAITDGVAVKNFAFAGRSTRTFIGEGRWDRLMAELRPGDTVLIQFGHNDASRDKPERFTRAWTDYRDNLLRFVWMTRGARATPVLLTPVARRSFNDRKQAQADFAEYSDVVREVAARTATPLIDLEALSRAWLDRAGPDASRAFYLHYAPADRLANYPAGIDDDTHFSELGARRVADLVAGALAGLETPVSKHISAQRPDLTRATPLGRGACR